MDLYQEHILEHYSHPRNRGELSAPSVTVVEYNPTCGDEIRVSMNIVEGIIDDVRFVGEGCAISTAAMSLFSEYIKGRSAEEVMSFEEEVVYDMLQVPISPGRVKCALLCLAAVRHALTQYSQV